MVTWFGDIRFSGLVNRDNLLYGDHFTIVLGRLNLGHGGLLLLLLLGVGGGLTLDDGLDHLDGLGDNLSIVLSGLHRLGVGTDRSQRSLLAVLVVGLTNNHRLGDRLALVVGLGHGLGGLLRLVLGGPLAVWTGSHNGNLGGGDWLSVKVGGGDLSGVGCWSRVVEEGG